MTDRPSRELLAELASVYNVATQYWSFHGELVDVSDDTLARVLTALGADTTSVDGVRTSILERELRSWRTVLPPCTVMRSGSQGRLAVHVPHGWKVEVSVDLEDGETWPLAQVEDFTQPRWVDGIEKGQASFLLPWNLPLGWHTLRARITPPEHEDWTEEVATLAVAPQKVACEKQSWGVMAQLYSVRSSESWGIGDTADLRELASLLGAWSADFLLVNPLHAAEVVPPISHSPYLPSTRRFFNPLYIRPEDIREVAYLPIPVRSTVAWAGEAQKKVSTQNTYLNRDAVWQAKSAALETIFTAGRSPARQRDFETYCEREGQGLADFALWCALKEKYQGREFPEELSDIHSPHVARARQRLADRIEYYSWLQWVMDEQLRSAQRSALDAGMEIGICHDLAVGVHPHSADVWTDPSAFAFGISVGAPPDMYNQQGQNWSQPPWNPVALEEKSYAPLRDMVRTLLRHAGALRIDHVMGLFRLWCIPEGGTPKDGTYVRYNHEAMVGVLLLEAYRAGAVLVGEDLGNVEPWVREYLKDRGILGTSVMWFEKDDDGGPLPPESFRDNVLATIDTHDLPPLAGYLAGEHVEMRERLGLLTEPVEKLREEAKWEREQMISFLRSRNLVGENPTEREIIEAMHVLLAQVPSKLIGVSLVDMVGERRAQNQPGTDQEYPNWRVPLADGAGTVVLLDDLGKHPRFVSLATTFTEAFRAHTAEAECE